MRHGLSPWRNPRHKGRSAAEQPANQTGLQLHGRRGSRFPSLLTLRRIPKRPVPYQEMNLQTICGFISPTHFFVTHSSGPVCLFFYFTATLYLPFHYRPAPFAFLTLSPYAHNFTNRLQHHHPPPHHRNQPHPPHAPDPYPRGFTLPLQLGCGSAQPGHG